MMKGTKVDLVMAESLSELKTVLLLLAELQFSEVKGEISWNPRMLLKGVSTILNIYSRAKTSLAWVYAGQLL